MPRDAFRLAFRANMSAESDTGELMLYGEITQNLPKWYKDNYPDDKSAIDFDKAVKDLKKAGAKKLLLRINSPGGVVNEAIAMRAIITGAGFENIDVHIGDHSGEHPGRARFHCTRQRVHDSQPADIRRRKCRRP